MNPEFLLWRDNMKRLMGAGALVAVLGLFSVSVEAGGKDKGDKGDKGKTVEKPAVQLNSPPPGFKLLFNGKDLTNWQGAISFDKRMKLQGAELTTAQEKANTAILPHWKAEEGILAYDGKGNSLATAKDYGDFELMVDWKIGKGGDSGIYLRGQPQVQIWDNKEGSGGLYNNKKAGQKPKVNADYPVGQWNTFHIIMKGDNVTIFLNGVKVVDNVALENYFEKGKALPATGPIELQHHGNPLWFRNIYIKEL
jgi:hypothetical protein